MVYCGKPSKGCSNCRRRKIRCDQREPTCGQCEKRQQQCPGYRNIVDLMFRDESSHVIKKAKAKAHKKGVMLVDPGPSSSGASSSSSASPEMEIRLSLAPGPVPAPVYGPALGPLSPRPRSARAISLITPSSGLPSRFVNYHHHNPNNTWARRSSSNDDGGGGGNNEDEDVDNNYDSDSDSDSESNFLLPSPNSGSWPATATTTASATPMITLLYSLNPTFQERGTAYFFSRYVTVTENPLHQRFDFIYDVWKPETMVPDRQVDGVLASMTALGLMGLASMTRAPQLMESARKSFGKALRLTNQALQSPTEAVRDSTMLSVLILGLFEMQIEDPVRTMKAFQGHVNGATALAKLRGPAQFRTAAGVRMFMMLCQRVVFSCILQQMPIPKPLLELQHEILKFVDPSESSWQFALSPLYKLVQARAEIRKGGINPDPRVTVAQLLAIDDEFERVMSRLPPAWSYRTEYVARPHPAIFNHTCYLYASIVHATSWNFLRTGRILVLETVLDEIHKDLCSSSSSRLAADPHYADVFRLTQHKLVGIIEAIAYSVPQIVGHIGRRGDDDMLAVPAAPSSASASSSPPVSTPISSVEARQTPSPPLSPSSGLSAGSVTSHSGHSGSSSGDMSSPESDDQQQQQQQQQQHQQHHQHQQQYHQQQYHHHHHHHYPEQPYTTTTIPEPDPIPEYRFTAAPTLTNPLRARDAADEAARFIALASAVHPVVWPLYMIGMSSAGSPSLRAYTIGRLRALHAELSLRQAGVIADLVEQADAEERAASASAAAVAAVAVAADPWPSPDMSPALSSSSSSWMEVALRPRVVAAWDGGGGGAAGGYHPEPEGYMPV